MDKTYLKVLEELKTLKKALIDVLDGDSAWYEIREKTGLPDDRCKEIAELFAKIIVEK